LVAGVTALFTGIVAAAAPALGGTQASPNWHVLKTFTVHKTVVIKFS
jgi:hypothetical protein